MKRNDFGDYFDDERESLFEDAYTSVRKWREMLARRPMQPPNRHGVRTSGRARRADPALRRP
jgi:hypothetical protein